MIVVIVAEAVIENSMGRLTPADANAMKESIEVLVLVIVDAADCFSAAAIRARRFCITEY